MEGIEQKRIEYSSLRLQCSLAIQALMNFQITEMPGEHGRGIFRVRLNSGTGAEQIAKTIYSEPIFLLEDIDGKSNGVPLFSGYLEEIKLTVEGEYKEAELTVLSGTVLFDRQRKDRVFQAKKQDYESIIGRVIKDTENGAFIPTIPIHGAIGPIFQYQETDWEFLKRVASQLGLPLVADTTYPFPRFYVGLRRGDVKKIPEESIFSLVFDGEQYYIMKEDGLKVAKEDFFCYDVTTWVNLGLGEYARINGRKLSVVRKEMVLQDGEVAYRYRFAGESYGLTCRKQNTDMIGISLPGKVTSIDGQMCELELDLEPGQTGGIQYPFAPETGNLLYCMPQMETRVNLVMGSGEGTDALISSCIRTNGAECEETGQPSKKYFYTEFGKGMGLCPESMIMTGGVLGSLLLDDASGTSLTSAKNLVAYAKGKICLESGKTIDMETLAGIFAETFREATSSLCINGRFDYLSTGALLQGRVYQPYEAFKDDVPKAGEFDSAGFWRNIGIGLAVVAVFAVAAVAVVATGGGAAALMAGTLAAGSKIALGACLGAAVGAAATTARIAVEDFNDGDVRSWQEASREIGISAFSGAITGALGARFPHMNKLLEGFIDTAVSTFERGFLKAFEEDVTLGEWLAYTFDPSTMAFDFTVGVTIDVLVDGVTDFFKGGKAAQVADEITDQLSDTMEDSMLRETREAMEDALGDSAERTARESAEEAAERMMRDTTGDLMDDFDEYEQFYEDLFDRQRESFGEYDDFLDDLNELSRKGADGGINGSAFDNFNPESAPIYQLGNFAEYKSYDNMVNNQSLKNNGYDLNPIGRPVPTSLDARMVKGIDGLYENLDPDSYVRYVIDEAKYGGAVQKWTRDGLQMSDDWLKGTYSGFDRILKAVKEDEGLAKKIRVALRRGQVDRVLSRVDKNGVVTTYLLDSAGEIIGTWP